MNVRPEVPPSQSSSTARRASHADATRMYREALRTVRQLGVPPLADERSDGKSQGLVRWRRTPGRYRWGIDRYLPALSRWREAARCGGEALPSALAQDDERPELLRGVAWLARVAELEGRRLLAARKYDWALELQLDMLRSAHDLAIDAPVDQMRLANELELATCRRLREWAGQRRIRPELADRAVRQVAEIWGWCGACEDSSRADAATRWERALRAEQRRRSSGSGATSGGLVDLAIECLLESASLPRSRRPRVLELNDQGAVASVAFPAEFLGGRGLSAELGRSPTAAEALELGELARLEESCDQRDVLVGATLATLAGVACQRRLGFYPDDLRSILREFDLAPPADPFDAGGGALRMRKATGVALRGVALEGRPRQRTRIGQPLVYSVGPDGQDDDGSLIWNGEARGEGDWVFPLPPHRRPRHWLQFDLTNILLLTTVVGMLCSLWFSTNTQQKRHVRQLRAMGASIEFAPPGAGSLRSLLAEHLGMDAYGTVTSVSLDSSQTNDTTLSLLAGFHELTELDLDNCKISDEGLVHLGRLTKLMSLSLSSTPITGEGLRHLAGLTALETLTMDNSQLTNEGLAAIPPLPSLNYLDADHNAALTSGGLRGLSTRFPNLQQLHIYDTRLADSELSEIGKCRGLTYIDLDGTQITSDGLRHLAGLQQLRTLDIQNTAIDDSGLVHLVGLASLEELRLNSTRVTGKGLETLAQIPKLADLSLDNNPSIRDRDLAPLAKAVNLRSLSVEGTRVRGTGLWFLRNLQLSVDYDEVESPWFDRVLELVLPGVTGAPAAMPAAPGPPMPVDTVPF